MPFKLSNRAGRGEDERKNAKVFATSCNEVTNAQINSPDNGKANRKRRPYPFFTIG